MSDSDTTAKRLRVLKTMAGVVLLASFLVSFVSTVNEMTGAFVTTSFTDSVSAESEIDESIDHILTIHKAAVPTCIVAFLVWVVCRRKLRAKGAITRIAWDSSSGSEG